MEKSDVKEIRKAVKAKESVIDWVYGLYVSSENEIVWEHTDYLRDMEEAERFRHMTMFSKVLSPHFGRDSFPLLISGQQDLLLSLRVEKRVTEDFSQFRDLLLSTYVHTDPYYATLTRIIYDVPVKTKDKLSLDDSEFVYEALLFCICPAKLSTPALGLKDDKVAELDRRWTIGNPRCGFLYPAFDGRMEDRNETLIYSTEPDTEDFINKLFVPADGVQPVGPKAQKNLFADLLSRMDIGITDAAAISEGILDHAAEEEAGDLLDARDVSRIAEAAGVRLDEEKLQEAYQEAIGTVPISVDALADKNIVVKTDAAAIKLPTDKAQLIETRTIDGRDYILIPADGSIEVNGMSVSAMSLLKENGVKDDHEGREEEIEEDFLSEEDLPEDNQLI